MRISYTEWWNDVVAIARANASILIAVAGALVFLPALVAGFFTVPMAAVEQGAEPAEILAAYAKYFSDNWVPRLVLLLLSTLAQLIVYIVLLDARRPRVGEAFAIAAPLFPLFFLLNILVSLILLGGAFLFLVPALYLVGRVLLSAPAFVAERRTNPADALGRSFALTRGQGWRIFFFAFLLFVVAAVIQLAVGGTLGTLLALTAGDADRFSLGNLLLAALDAIFTAIYFILSAATWVALFRRLAAGSPARTGA